MKEKRRMTYKKVTISLMATSILLAYQATVHANEIQTTEETAVEQVTPGTVAGMTSEEVAQPVVATEASKEVSTSDLPVVAPQETSVESTEEVSEAKPVVAKAEVKSNLDLQDSSNVKALWQEAGQGEGSVVAVIDTGMDLTHEMLQLTAPEKAHYTDEKSLEKVKQEQGIAYGKWVNSKLAFFHDYTENPKADSKDGGHGTHVSGIVAGNASPKESMPYHLKGILPEAQLLFMKVATPSGSKEFPLVYAKAIYDAVKLGATSINMSLGKGSESVNDLPKETLEALAFAKEKGVAIVTSAGNDAAFGGEQRKPLAENPDFGVVGSPAVVDSVLAVASYRPAEMLSEVMTVTAGEETKELALLSVNPFEKGKTYAYQFANFGQKGDFANLKGKIALVERGQIDFKDKIQNAKDAGAEGIIIFNNQPKGSLIELPKVGDFATAFISQESGQWLKEKASAQLLLDGKVALVSDNTGNRISTFSSWGVTADGSLKPDIAAPGEDIYSSLNGNTYGKLSGTSMASPHVAGIMALLQKVYATKYPTLSAKQRLELATNVLMSSATALYNEEAKAFYSPRQQGAGSVDAQKASKAELYVTDGKGNAKIHLKNIGETFVVSVTVHNMSSKDQVLTYQANVLADQVEGKYFALTSRSLQDTPWQTVTVKANDTTTLDIVLDTKAFTEQLTKEMPNGYFVDGFIRFRNEGSEAELMSIPFIGFKGDFANLPALETPIYKTLKEGSFYHKPAAGSAENLLDKDGFNPTENSFTALYTDATSWSSIKELNDGEIDEELLDSEPIYLGTFAQDDDKYYVQFRTEEEPFFAISPNGDNNRDKVQFQGTFLRNVKNITAKVFNANEQQVWESKEAGHNRKNFANELEAILGKLRLDYLEWDGTDHSGETVPDGEYTYRVSYTPVAEGAKEQFIDFTIIVHTKAPKLPTDAQFNLENNVLTLTTETNREFPIYRERIAYTYLDGGEMTTMYVEQNEDGSYTLPTEGETMEGEPVSLTIDNFTYVIEDMAGNLSYIPLSKLLLPADVNVASLVGPSGLAQFIQKFQEPAKRTVSQKAEPTHFYKPLEKEETLAIPVAHKQTENSTKVTSPVTSTQMEMVKTTEKANLPKTGERKAILSILLGAVLLGIVSLSELVRLKRPRSPRQ